MKRNPAMTDDPSIGGLCVNCRHAPECIYPREDRLPVLHCEEFELVCIKPYRPKEKNECVTVVQVTPCEQDKKILGLCVNCRHLETCTFPKPEGGVWHCEEYEC